MALILPDGVISVSIVELLFCLPLSNGRLERVFSQLKLVKPDRRSRLSEDSIDNHQAPPLQQWDASGALKLDKTRRLNIRDPQ